MFGTSLMLRNALHKEINITTMELRSWSRTRSYCLSSTYGLSRAYSRRARVASVHAGPHARHGGEIDIRKRMEGTQRKRTHRAGCVGAQGDALVEPFTRASRTAT